jgi:hypothetical protein
MVTTRTYKLRPFHFSEMCGVTGTVEAGKCPESKMLHSWSTSGMPGRNFMLHLRG